MNTRKLGYSDLQLTPIGLGTWAIGGGDNPYGWGPQDDRDSIAAIQRALDLGINWIDSAAGYGKGHSEEVIGQAIAGRRDKVILATKCGILWQEDGSEIYGHLKADSIRREVENSLRRLKVEVIDLYQIHWPMPDEDIEEGWAAIAALVKEGKVRYGGVSNFNVEQIKRILAIHPVASLQPPYSMVLCGIEAEILPFCAANNIGVIVYSPMQAGLLTGKMTRERVAQLPADDWRKVKSPPFQEPELSINLDLVEALRPMAARNGRSVGELAVAWVLRRPEVTAAIVGARRPAQIEEIVGAGEWHLTAEDIAAVDLLLSKRDQQLAQLK
jgi:aryl-alcohol dehydrogenase-like predicted oxidoreductase